MPAPGRFFLILDCPSKQAAQRLRCAESISYAHVVISRSIACFPPQPKGCRDLDLWSQVHNLILQTFSLEHMTRPQRICVDVRFIMWVKDAWLPAMLYALHARRISESENTPSGTRC